MGVGDPIGETQETYAAIASAYARRNSEPDEQVLEDVAVFVATLPANAVVADVGCGPGRDILLLRERGHRVVGLDMSIAQLRAGGLAGVVQADMRRLPLASASVDAIWCDAALLHIPRDDVAGVLGEFARAVKPDGRLFLAVVEGDGEGWEVATKYGSDQRRWFTYHREPAMTATLAEAGFATERVTRTAAQRTWLSIHARRVSSREMAARR